eukprot:CAMPEP_0176448468 /NCGR_PEP_ID=MMETSP0127-20121128/25800_1 /TAXON_ID=938130 /ORGANISM="Platyophrya macrostoma, Strain WH" /LENGTH=80 /DNA_ID=CAMNT_0017835421 /DNA_START=52 /DNA_END=290 /DNA_ORIENTATION=+
MRLGCNRVVSAAIGAVRHDDPRMGTLFTDSIQDAKVVLIGFPLDEGCIRNGGRPGARLGPSAFRTFVTCLGACHNVERNV